MTRVNHQEKSHDIQKRIEILKIESRILSDFALVFVFASKISESRQVLTLKLT